ncbi:hypothetical protein BFP97_14055 [Roseivirga sp. 4D4]|uniref:hypothetical protein n=1 Tax=Roseivirga sp. 4D4 TaxID=1889784 RepID=UPI0008529ABD|nr:hypothetical protein [Roseivirga sp. 4D4]OEK02577.1 hypothetical protein BFP97_14055 [Roseivirga sp. 4D4]
MEKIIDFVQNLSLDITGGAVISSLYVAQLFGVELSSQIVLGLAIAIWLIYTADHLWDGYRVKGDAVNPRHAFHQRHFKLILGIAVFVFGCGVYNTFELLSDTIWFGLGLVALTGLYFFYLKFSKAHLQKELFAAFVYVAGIFVGPMSLLEHWDWFMLGAFIQFFLLAYVNLMLFPLFEKDEDDQQGMASIVTNRGAEQTRKRIVLALILNGLIAIACIGLGINEGKLQFMILAMSWPLLLLFLRQDVFKRYKFYRIIGDGIFFLPGLALL